MQKSCAWLAGALWVAVLAALIMGCSPSNNKTPIVMHRTIPNAPPREPDANVTGSLLVVAVDTSGSTGHATVREQYLNIIDQCLYRSLGNRCALWVFAFDREVNELWGPDVPRRRDALDDVKRQFKPSPHQGRFTRPALLLERLVRIVEADPSRQVHAVVLTDGDAELQEDKTRFEQAGDRLSKEGRFRMIVGGIRPSNRSNWRTAFDSMGETRLRLAGPGKETDAAVVQFLREIRETKQ